MAFLNIGIIRGGAGSGYEESLCSGATVSAALGEAAEEREWQVHDIFIDRNGVWHRGGVARSPERSLRMLDVAVNALHGEGGEDGALARTLESFGVAHTGTLSSSASALADRGRARALAQQSGVRIPLAYTIRAGEEADALGAALFRTVSPPALVRAKDSALVTPVFAGDDAALAIALRQVLLYSPATAVLVEEHIPGQRLALGVLERFRGESLYVLPFAETEPGGEIVCPARIKRAVKEKMVSAARGLFAAFGLRHYALFEFAASENDTFFLDVRTLPALRENACFQRSLASVGATLGEFAEHMISLALMESHA
ncbi:MAG: hypothetical protein Q8R39_01105 [bacterium]|nr:hypothetical protein [bacterium]MDZ4285166.1 hypothetical protein [Patescibacteria group bacterium]